MEGTEARDASHLERLNYSLAGRAQLRLSGRSSAAKVTVGIRRVSGPTPNEISCSLRGGRPPIQVEGVVVSLVLRFVFNAPIGSPVDLPDAGRTSVIYVSSKGACAPIPVGPVRASIKAGMAQARGVSRRGLASPMERCTAKRG